MLNFFLSIEKIQQKKYLEKIWIKIIFFLVFLKIIFHVQKERFQLKKTPYSTCM